MACFKPLEAWRLSNGAIVFHRKDASAPIVKQVALSCGQCVGCRLERSRQWAVRCIHESKCWKRNCFVTLTYDDEHLPRDGGLHYRDFQLFMKRLRKRYHAGIRFFMCGEYGDENRRPHFHACLFNHDFADRYRWKTRSGVSVLFRSPSLDELWPNGFASVGEVTFESAAYVARYVMKKVTGDDAESHYRTVDPETGEVFDISPEFTHMSLKPGIGAWWFQRFHEDLSVDGMVITRGQKSLAPRFYMRRLKHYDPDAYDRVSKLREEYGELCKEDSTPERLAVRETVARARANLFKRDL